MTAAPMAVTAATELKARADSAFRSGAAAQAVELYTQALAEESPEPPPHLLHANRSTAALRAGDAALAVADALACVRLDASYVKGYYRLGAALLKAGWPVAALRAFQAGAARTASAEMADGIEQVRGAARVAARRGAARRRRARRGAVRRAGAGAGL